METKVCSCCKEEKVLSDFRKRNDRDCYTARCISCLNAICRAYREKNKEAQKETNRRNYLKNRDERLEYRKTYYESNKDAIAERDKKKRRDLKENDPAKYQSIIDRTRDYYRKNRDEINSRRNEKRKTNREYINFLAKKYRDKNRDTINEKAKLHREKYGDKYNFIRRQDRLTNHPRYIKRKMAFRERDKMKRQTDPLYFLKRKISNAIGSTFRLKGYGKRSTTFQILGIDCDGFKSHLESKFLCGMSWENKHLWHIDHIIPIDSAKSEEDVVSLNHYTNFQPLWAEVNIWKSNNIDFDLQGALEYWYSTYALEYGIDV